MRERIKTIAERLRVNTGLTGKGITMGFLDGGFAYHPDFSNPSGRIKAFHDVLNPDKEAHFEFEENLSAYHGTCVVMSAIGKGDYPGLSPDVDLVLVDVGREDVLDDDHIAKGFEWFLKNHKKYGIRVIVTACNASEHCEYVNEVVDALADKGVVVVAAAGNGRGRPWPPATSKKCITVGGYFDGGDGLDFLEYVHKCNESKPTILAPATDIPVPMIDGYNDKNIAEKYFLGSLEKEDFVIRKRIISKNYRLIDGTSLAAPIVGSVIALMLEARPDLTPLEIERIIKDTSNMGAICVDKILAYI